MNIILTPSQLDELAFATAKRNAANPTSAPMSDADYAAELLGVYLYTFEQQRKKEAREALIPVADEILAAPADKQAAAINAALNAVRS